MNPTAVEWKPPTTSGNLQQRVPKAETASSGDNLRDVIKGAIKQSRDKGKPSGGGAHGKSVSRRAQGGGREKREGSEWEGSEGKQPCNESEHRRESKKGASSGTQK
jgi:hypothetical protein